MHHSLGWKHRDSSQLSSLARGTGLVDGGVEIECYPEYGLSLSGKAFLKSSSTTLGQSAKVYKPHVLNLPKTYVTRRGQMVLFTSPEDMIIGSACQVHRKTVQQKIVSRCAASRLKTTDNLVSTALSYEPEKDSGISEGESDSSPPQPGHFNTVYLNKLQQKPSSTTTENDLIEEDIEDPASTGGTVIPVSEPDHDSGLEDSCHSVPRVSAVVVPDGHWNRKEEEEKNDDEILQQLKPTGVAQHMDSRPASSELTRIMFELNQKPQQKPLKKKTSTSGGGRSGRKKAQKGVAVSKTHSGSTENKQKENEQMSVTEIDSQQRKAKGSGKKRNKKHKRSHSKEVEYDKLSSPSADERGLHQSVAISAVQLAEQLGDNVSPVATDLNSRQEAEPAQELDPRQRRRSAQIARAEERRREIERKRTELRLMELQRLEEEARKQELLNKLAQDAKQQMEEAAIKDAVPVIVIDDDLQRRIAEEEEEEARRRREKSMLLENRGDEVDKSLELAEKEAQEAMLKAKLMRQRIRAEEERKRKLEQEKERERLQKLKEEEEERDRLRQLQTRQDEEEQSRRAEERARLLAYEEEEARRLNERKELDYKSRLEQLTKKHHQLPKTSHFFSYFRYVPPSVSSTNKNGKNTRKKATVRAKRK